MLLHLMLSIYSMFRIGREKTSSSSSSPQPFSMIPLCVFVYKDNYHREFENIS